MNVTGYGYVMAVSHPCQEKYAEYQDVSCNVVCTFPYTQRRLKWNMTKCIGTFALYEDIIFDQNVDRIGLAAKNSDSCTNGGGCDPTYCCCV